MNLIKVENLEKSYKKNRALDGIFFDVHAGEMSFSKAGISIKLLRLTSKTLELFPRSLHCTKSCRLKGMLSFLQHYTG
jgi:ABC-type ATPase involved in cell division